MVDKSQKNDKGEGLKLATKRHQKFYFDNTLLVIQVEDTLFNVHKYQLLKSKVFADMFEAAQGDPDEGSSPDNPIMLEGVSASDFECLLEVLYATTPTSFFSHFSTQQPAPEASLVIPAFRLANKWSFDDLRNYLLPLAEKELNDVDKIVFGREFDIKAWLAPAHSSLCLRNEPITDEEAAKLGTNSVALISRLREELRQGTVPPGNKTCCGCAGYSVNDGAEEHKCHKCGGTSHVLTRGSDQPNRDAIVEKVQKWVDDGGS
ncbi:The BTB (BR-C, ttk and bab)/POZ (Pox virus and Zinc finger) domain [Ceratobasidium sp. AG-Ba]|nr:The BTB (BR-C, ttk and bab)/POZ (Pox virus and Zinc finger) domain [Ceratobasidium sp. AG-Ba]